jgi:16S rRNA (uracil1498-N3)-methyltransferase
MRSPEMPRFFVHDPIQDEKTITISGTEARHVQRVFRLKVGDRVELFDGSGKEYLSEIIRQDRQTVTVKVLETRAPERQSPLSLIMGQSLIKGDKMDLVVQKANELGISTFVPFVSSRSVNRPDSQRAEGRVERWKRITTASSKQCGRTVPMEVLQILPFADALKIDRPGTQRIILSESEPVGLKSLLRETKGSSVVLEGVYFMVGPEGGFSEEELKQAGVARFLPVRLGSRIMRAETVVLACASILQYEWGDLG